MMHVYVLSTGMNVAALELDDRRCVERRISELANNVRASSTRSDDMVALAQDFVPGPMDVIWYVNLSLLRGICVLDCSGSYCSDGSN